MRNLSFLVEDQDLFWEYLEELRELKSRIDSSIKTQSAIKLEVSKETKLKKKPGNKFKFTKLKLRKKNRQTITKRVGVKKEQLTKVVTIVLL